MTKPKTYNCVACDKEVQWNCLPNEIRDAKLCAECYMAISKAHGNAIMKVIDNEVN